MVILSMVPKRWLEPKSDGVHDCLELPLTMADIIRLGTGGHVCLEAILILVLKYMYLGYLKPFKYAHLLLRRTTWLSSISET